MSSSKIAKVYHKYASTELWNAKWHHKNAGFLKSIDRSELTCFFLAVCAHWRGTPSCFYTITQESIILRVSLNHERLHFKRTSVLQSRDINHLHPELIQVFLSQFLFIGLHHQISILFRFFFLQLHNRRRMQGNFEAYSSLCIKIMNEKLYAYPCRWPSF